MSRQAKIIIFSLILVFSIYLKQTKDNSISDDPTVIKQRNFTKEDFRGTIPVNKKIERKKPNLTPKNGFSPYDKYFGKGIYDNSSGNEFVVKNSNETDAIVLLVNAYTGRKVRNEFVAKASNFKMTGVPNGTYYLEWFSGTNWSPELKVGTRFKGGFQTKASFTKTKDRSDWMSVDGYRQWTVTLYSVAGGDVESKKINADEFFN
tara:strand:+ start:734 stop:1348 length:615 start_codon:yes stop_codon:yes gene_type:complete